MQRNSSALQFVFFLFAAMIGIVAVKAFVMNFVLASGADIAVKETVQEVSVGRPVAMPNGPLPEIKARSPRLGGKWDSGAAQAIAIEYLSRALVENVETNDCTHGDEEDCMPAHWFLREQAVVVNGETNMAVLFGSNTGREYCHLCLPDLSLFEFQQRNGSWTLAHSDLAFTKWGVSGRINSEQVSFHQLDQNSYAVLLTTSDAHQGFVGTLLVIFARLGDGLEPILDTIYIGDDNEGYYGDEDPARMIRIIKWNTTVSFVPLSDDKPDLVLTRRGTYEGKDLDEVQRFRFVGRKYIPVEGPSPPPFSGLR